MIRPTTTEPPAAIIHTAEGTWRCSACGGFVRQDARICKHCKCSFGRNGAEAAPAVGRMFLILIGTTEIVVLCALLGLMLGGYLWPGHGDELMGPASMWIGLFAGLVTGLVIAPIAMNAALRSR